MILNIIRWLRGYVVFEILGRFPERFINLSIRQGYFLFGAKSNSKGFFASMLLCDYREIRSVARRSRVRLQVRERHGLPFLLSRYRLRMGLVAGFAGFLILTQLMQSFVWTVEINGINTISESSVISKLKDMGLYQGVYKNSLDLQSLERGLMQDVEEIGWMSINLIGTKAEVEIKEKEKKPDIVDVNIPCNVKASEDGIILSMNVRQGTAKTAVGSAVIEGQLLVSGITENSLEQVSFVHADARVLAKTQRNVTFIASARGEYRLPTETAERRNLVFYWLKCPVTFSSVGGEYASRIITEKIFINDTCIELGTITERCTKYEKASYTLSEDKAQKRLYSDEALCRLFTLGNCESIAVSDNITKTRDKYLLSADYTLTEDIAYTENIIVN